MSRISLLERVIDVNVNERPVLLTDLHGYNVTDLGNAVRAVPLSHLQRRGNIVLQFECNIKLAMALLALDGTAKQLLLLPSTLLPASASELIARFKPSLVVTDRAVSVVSGVENVLWNNDVPAALSAWEAVQNRRDTLWVLATSGTTGTPKLVGHRLTSLLRTTKLATNQSNSWRWGQMFDLARFAGIQVFLQGLLGGGGLVLPDQRSTLAARVETLVRCECSALSATPTMWRKLLMTPEAKALRLQQATLGGEIADNAILEALATRFPNARITHVFASTETGAAFSVLDGKAGFPASFLDEPPRGIRLRVKDGRLSVHNEAVSPTYVGGVRFVGADYFVDTGDVVERVGDRFHFRGRDNGAINVGGNKIFPEEVEEILLGQELVVAVRVYAKASAITGQLVAAEIVIADECSDPEALIATLKSRCRAILPLWAVPAVFKIISEINTSPGDKVKRSIS